MKQVEQQGQQNQEPMQVQQKPDVSKQEMQEPVRKKSKWWLWLIIALIVLGGVGAAVYFLFIR